MSTRMLHSSFSNDSLPLSLLDRDFKQQNTTNLPHSSSAALHQSILDGRLKQVQYLLKLGSRVNTKDIYGRSSLMLACLCDHEEYGYKVAKLLLEYGADLNIQDHLGRTAVFLSCSEKREKLIELFVDQNPLLIDYRLCDTDGNSLVNYASIHATSKSVRRIVNKMNRMYIPIDQRNHAGYTALLLAVKHKRYMNAYILLNEGNASPFLKDNENFLNPIEWIERNNAENEQLLASLANKNSALNKSFNNDIIETNESIKSASTLTFSIPQTQQQQAQTQAQANLKQANLHYKMWYGVPNQYHTKSDLQRSKCEHLNYTNYSVDHHNATYVPAIFTPRLNKQRYPSQPDYEMIVTQDDREVAPKLLEKLKEKMSQSTYIPQNAKNPSFRLTVDRIAESPLDGNRDTSMSMLSNAQTPSYYGPASRQAASNSQLFNHKTPMNQRNHIFLIRKQPSPTDSINTTAILALQPATKATIKDELHNIFEFYTGSQSYSTNNKYLRERKAQADTSITSNSTVDASKGLTAKQKNAKPTQRGATTANANDKNSKEVTFNLKK